MEPPAEEEGSQMISLEASERQAAAQRAQDWDRLQDEVEQINGPSRVMTRSRIRRLIETRHREQVQPVLDPIRQSPRPNATDPDASFLQVPRTTASSTEESFPPTPSVIIPGTAVRPTVYPEEVCGSDADDEYEIDESDGRDQVDSSDGRPPATRWISLKDLVQRGLFGWGIYTHVYRSGTTDALFFQDYLQQRIWLTDAKGDCVLAQDQNLSAPETVDRVEGV
ncbi:hypothetical protein diail_10356 [Diaporthe ilicicola]|nr:hypothetical protein diail_10356 [Diaporthe ilicicola]